MGKFQTFIWSYWNDIKGNVKYGLLFVAWAGGSAVIGWLASYIQKLRGAPLQDRLGYEILAILIFCALVLSSMFLYIVARRDRRQGATHLSALPLAELVLTEPVKDTEIGAEPLQVDLQGEVLELHIWHTWSTFSVATAQVFLRARIVNRGLSDATITSVGLVIELGGYRKVGSPISIPRTLEITNPPQDPSAVQGPIAPALGVSSTSAIYKRGIPHEGWLAFEVFVHGTEQFPNAQFDLLLEDSFGKSHRISRKAGVYRTPHQLVVPDENAY